MVESWRVNPLLIASAIRRESGAVPALFQRSSQDPLVIGDPRLLSALVGLPATFDKATALKIFEQIVGAETASELWSFSVAEDLVTLLPPDGKDSLDHWREIGWANAGIFHEATRNHPFLNMSQPRAFTIDNNLMKQYAVTSDAPSPYKAFGSELRIPLPKLEKDATDRDIIALSHTGQLAQLAIILDLALGARQHLSPEIDEEDEFFRMEMVKKAVPSGGSRHPVEGFVFLNDAWASLEGGYSYDTKSHALVYTNVDEAWFKDLDEDRPIASIILTARWERAMWRYRESRSARALFLDAGHVAAMLEQAARFMDLTSETFPPPSQSELPFIDGWLPDDEPPLAKVVIKWGSEKWNTFE